MEFVMEVLANDSMEKMGLAVASFITLVVILQAGTLIKLIRDVKLNIKDMSDRVQEQEKHIKPEEPNTSPEQEMRIAIVNAVNEAMQVAIGQAVGQTLMRAQVPVIEPVDTSTTIPAGIRYQGNMDALRPTTGGRPAIYQ